MKLPSCFLNKIYALTASSKCIAGWARNPAASEPGAIMRAPGRARRRIELSIVHGESGSGTLSPDTLVTLQAFSPSMVQLILTIKILL
jgi:hypothetical protein